MKYKKKPVVVEAVRFNGLTEPMFSERPDWLEERINAGDIYPREYFGKLGVVDDDILFEADAGDYIVKEADGINLYSPDEFKETYDAMNDVTN